jgi:hypothetical protein
MATTVAPRLARTVVVLRVRELARVRILVRADARAVLRILVAQFATMTRWKVVPIGETLLETETHYTGQFDIHNMDSGEVVRVEYTQRKNKPISDAIGSLQALARCLYDAATEEAEAAPRLN